MDVIKVFTEEPVGLEALVPDDDPDARRRSEAPATLDAFVAGLAAPYARAYLAGTHLGDVRRVGLTALDDAEAWVQPLLAWAAGRACSALASDGMTRGLVPAEVAGLLRRPGAVRALAVGPVAPGALAAATGAEEGGQRRDHLTALRALLDGGASVLFPETAFDGWDWSLFSRAPLRDALVAAFRQHPAPGVRRFVAPYRRARGEHSFYFEQWALDALPEWAEEV
ncbi:hypothetical protein [Rubrivirga sp.]|uniref:hypothetical protein n=1 Tax=Rubrivirga sp. TaxID=1885344 RepID=UPI003B530495